MTPYTTTVLLAVTTAILPRNRVDAGGTRLRLRALHVMGHGSPRIARAVGASAKTIRSLVSGDTTTITPQLRDAITAVYDAWWDKRAPARTPAERAAATAARKRAIAGNWCAAAALEDDQLDTPGYRPAGAGNPPPEPASPLTFTRPYSSKEGACARRRTLDLGPHPRGPRRPGTPGSAAATTSTPVRPSDSSTTWPTSTRAPWTLPLPPMSWCRHHGRSQPAARPVRRHRLD